MNLMNGFKVIDLKTGKEPDLRQIAYKEEWASNLMSDDMEGFFLGEDGLLILMDECGNSTCCPLDRFEIKFM